MTALDRLAAMANSKAELVIVNRDDLKELLEMAGHKTRRKPPRAVRCIETGETFETLTSVAAAFDCDISALSRHLSGRKGFRTVAGHTFERINA